MHQYEQLCSDVKFEVEEQCAPEDMRSAPGIPMPLAWMETVHSNAALACMGMLLVDWLQLTHRASREHTAVMSGRKAIHA